jgi:hypothetical protein
VQNAFIGNAKSTLTDGLLNDVFAVFERIAFFEFVYHGNFTKIELIPLI